MAFFCKKLPQFYQAVSCMLRGMFVLYLAKNVAKASIFISVYLFWFFLDVLHKIYEAKVFEIVSLWPPLLLQ